MSLIKKITKNYIIIFICLTGLNLPALEDVMTNFQFNASMSYTKLSKQLKNKIINYSELKKTINPLLIESLKDNDLWSDRSKFMSLIKLTTQEHKELSRLWFSFIYTGLIKSKRFNSADLVFKQKACNQLIILLSTPDYKDLYPTIQTILFQNFHDNKFYNNSAIEKIERIIIQSGKFNHLPTQRYLLLLFILNRPVHYHVKIKLQEMADGFKVFDRKKTLASFIAILLLARNGEEKYSNKLISVIKRTSDSNQGIKDATYMFPYLSIVQKPEIVDLMRIFLKNDNFSEKENLEIRQNRKKIISNLISNFYKSNNKEYKRSIIYTLGEMRAIEAIPFLIKNINYGLVNKTPPQPKYGMTPSGDALYKIGFPSIKPILKELQETNNKLSSMILISSLTDILGCDLAMSSLKKQIDSANSSEYKTKLEKAIKVIEKYTPKTQGPPFLR